jgi:hypothetical protein
VLLTAVKLLIVPPDIVISTSVKSVVASLAVKVTVRIAFDEDQSSTALMPLVAVIEMVGTVVSITSALFAPRELVAPGAGNVRVTSEVPPVSVMVPLFKARDVVAT